MTLTEYGITDQAATELQRRLEPLSRSLSRAIGMHLDPSAHTDLHELLIDLGASVDAIINDLDE